ncbi:MAG TPA: hypothetical protein VGF67_18675 [Ktedonobacteraceae bacterium]|jgi:uncharacterized membrane protein
MHRGIGLWPVFALFWIGVCALLCCGAVRWLGRGERYLPGTAPCDAHQEVGALEIVRRRYARGEIVDPTLEPMRERLGRSGRPLA